ncbi:DUF3237 domain-containing protein [Marinobacterium iners]|uniref:UPF0311 protein SAMN02745729_12319 n=1 Tax=Marinobacterium iners DSM 11526 TaxID=1122198 RepID=A0A1H4H0T4_9GAMM|nr:DUF3237 domain-containing protein [Marinobacterium iners]SEB14930.1 Protein of unknown function [Marinobacterium iners DSM 11526]
MMLPSFEPFASLKITVDDPLEVGVTQAGVRRVIPITGGEVVGNGWRGQVLSGGADFQLIVSPRMAELDARYVLETESGDRIYVVNRAIRVAEPEVTRKLMRGEPVDPDLIYFRCTPRFETESESFKWITESLFIGTGVRNPDSVELHFYRVS